MTKHHIKHRLKQIKRKLEHRQKRTIVTDFEQEQYTPNKWTSTTVKYMLEDGKYTGNADDCRVY